MLLEATEREEEFCEGEKEGSPNSWSTAVKRIQYIEFCQLIIRVRDGPKRYRYFLTGSKTGLQLPVSRQAINLEQRAAARVPWVTRLCKLRPFAVKYERAYTLGFINLSKWHAYRYISSSRDCCCCCFYTVLLRASVGLQPPCRRPPNPQTMLARCCLKIQK